MPAIIVSVHAYYVIFLAMILNLSNAEEILESIHGYDMFS